VSRLTGLLQVVALVGLMLVLPRVAQAADGVVAGAEVRCDLALCDDAEQRASLLALAGVEVGAEWNGERATQASKVLESAGMFEQVTVTDRACDGGLCIVVALTGKQRIADVSIEPGGALTSEIQRRLFLRSGSIWTGDEETLARQRRAIEEYFDSTGYLGSKVVIEAKERPGRLVDVTVRAELGRQATLRRLAVRGNQAIPFDRIRDVVLGEMSLTRGYTKANLRSALEAVQALYRNAGYLRARVVRSEAHRVVSESVVDLFLEVDEGGPWRIEVAGNTAISRGEVISTAALGSAGLVDGAVLEEAAEQVRRRYESLGYTFAEVTARVVEDAGVEVVTFSIIEGSRLPIRKIALEGVPEELREAILAQLETRPLTAFGSGGYLIRAGVAADLRRIEQGMRDAGYQQAVAIAYKVARLRDGSGLDVTFSVQAGERLTASKVRYLLEGEGRPSPVELGLEEGGAYAASAYQAAKEALKRWWTDRGYPSVEVTGVCRDAVGAEVACEAVPLPETCRIDPTSVPLSSCRDKTRTSNRDQLFVCPLVMESTDCASVGAPHGRSVAVDFEVTRGRLSRFGGTLLLGNHRSQSGAVLAELKYEAGEPYSMEAIYRTQAGLRSLGIFDSVRASTLSVAKESGEDVVYTVLEVEETHPWTVDANTGVEFQFGGVGRKLLVLSNEPVFRHRNILGRMEEFRASGNLDIDPSSLSRLSSGEVKMGANLSYFDPRFHGFGLFRDATEALVEVYGDRDRLTLAPAPQVDEWGVGARARDESDTRRGLFFEFGISFRNTRSIDQSGEADRPVESAAILSATPRVTYDRRNHPLRPTAGYLAEVGVELADDFVGLSDASAFTKLTARAVSFWSLAPGVVAATQLRGGYATGGLLSGFDAGRSLALPLSERFLMGGSGSVRGFGEGAIKTVEGDASGGDVFVQANVELRYGLVPALGVEGAAFLDAGELAREAGALSAGELRSAAGLGLRWVIANMIPVAFDYGTNLSRRIGEPFGRFHLNVGYTF